MFQNKDTVADTEAEAFRRLGYQAIDLVADYLENIRQTPVFRSMTNGERQELLESTLAEEGQSGEVLLAYIREHIFTHPMGNGHPRFFGWAAPTPHPLGAIADLLAASLNPNCVGGDHAATYLELATVRWLMELLGFPTEGSMGVLVSGGSMATLTCLTAARHWIALLHGWNDRLEGVRHERPLVLYQSEEGHICIQKAVELLGLGTRAIRRIPVDEQFHLRTDLLQAAIREDREAGALPFCVVASAGTINTGAVDPLDRIADICEEEGLWLHIDGSLGAIGRLDPAVSARFSGLERANSLAVDPHKGFSVPIECGCALVRDKEMLWDTFHVSPACLHVEEGKGLAGPLWFSEYGFQLTRGFRALKLWMILQSVGRQGFSLRAKHYHRLASLLAYMLEDAPDFVLMAPVELYVVCFRYAPVELIGEGEILEQLNRAIVPIVHEGGDALVSSTEIRGQFALRACILHETTTDDDIAFLVDVIRRAGQAVMVGVMGGEICCHQTAEKKCMT